MVRSVRSAEIVCKANGCFGHRASSVFRRGGMRAYIYCSKVSSKRRKCRFRDPSFKMGFQTYIFCSKVPSKCRKCRFRDPNFKQFPGGHTPGPPYNCVVTMASPSLKSWLRHCTEPLRSRHNSRFLTIVNVYKPTVVTTKFR